MLSANANTLSYCPQIVGEGAEVRYDQLMLLLIQNSLRRLPNCVVFPDQLYVVSFVFFIED